MTNSAVDITAESSTTTSLLARAAGRQVEAWQKLLATNPGYPEAERVRSLIAETK